MPPVPLFSALADQTRCIIIEMLRTEPLPVHRLADAFSISRPAISRHLRVLGEAGLVAERKQGRENIYALQTSAMEAGRTWLDQFAGGKPVVVEGRVAEPKPVKAKTVKSKRVKPVVVEPVPEPMPEPLLEKPAPKKPARPAKPEPASNAGQMELF